MNQLEKARIRARRWYRDNRERVLSNSKKKNDNPVVKKLKSEYDKNRRVLNSEKIRENMSRWYLENKQSQIEKAKIWKDNNPIKAQYSRYKSRAVLKNSKFSLSLEEFKKVIESSCVYCGFNDGLLGIDRIDSLKGYEKDNIVPCCKVCNYMKLDHTFEEWMTAMSDVFENLGYEIAPSPKDDSRR